MAKQQQQRRRGRPPHDDLLTPAEWRTVHAVQHGKSTRQIAHGRGVSIDAVKFHVANVLDKLGLSRRTALRGWFTIPRHSALGQQQEAVMAERTSDIELSPVGQISRSVLDIGKAKAFYGGVLGLPHLYTFGNLAFFDCGGMRLYLQQSDEPGPESVLYFRVDT